MSSTDGDSSINFSSDKSYRSQVLDSDESEEDGDPKDLHRDLTDDESDDDVPLVTKGKLAVISSDSEEQESDDEEDGAGRFQTFSSEKPSIEDSFAELSFNSDSRPNFPKKTASRIRGRHDDSMDSPMVRNIQAKTSEDYLDTPVSKKVISNPIDSSHGDSPMLQSVQKRRNRLISSSDEESADEKEDRSPPSSNINDDDKSSMHNDDN